MQNIIPFHSTQHQANTFQARSKHLKSDWANYIGKYVILVSEASLAIKFFAFILHMIMAGTSVHAILVRRGYICASTIKVILFETAASSYMMPVQ